MVQLPCGKWNLPAPGIEPVSPVLAGGFLGPGPPGKPQGVQFEARSMCGAGPAGTGVPETRGCVGRGQSEAGRGTGVSRLAVALVRQDSERKWAGQGGAGRRPQRDWARAGLGGQGGSRAEGQVRGGSVLPQSAGVGWAGPPGSPKVEIRIDTPGAALRTTTNAHESTKWLPRSPQCPGLLLWT